MLSQLIKLIAASFIWKKYKRTLLTAACLFVYLWLVGFIHNDYLSYREAEGNASNLGFSFVIKWLAWIVGIAVFVFYDSLKKRKENSIGEKGKRKEGDRQSLGLRKKYSSGPDTSVNKGPVAEKDPFAAIREKKKLRSKGDITISKKAIDDDTQK
ncbi:MAG: hypothetical protein ACI89U_002837 [Gammaproteobacteria bacterium]|jgi:hypothetical protein